MSSGMDTKGPPWLEASMQKSIRPGPTRWNPPKIACLSCRTRRRKCDRIVPTCSECTGLGRSCVYITRKRKDRAPLQTDCDAEWLAKYHTGSGLVRSPPIIHKGLFATRPRDLKIQARISPEIFKMLGRKESIVYTLSRYWATIHRWMPIVSKTSLHKGLSSRSTEPRADLVLLLMCMKVIITAPMTDNQLDMRTTTYLTAKGFYRKLTLAGSFSTQLLQAGLLLSLYELGHAIYPEAHLSIAANARLGIALGINEPDSQTMDPAPLSWTEQEERTRTWWGLVILDRYVSLGIRGRPLSTPDPNGNHYVPVDDMAWEEDKPVAKKTMITESTSDNQVPVFAREAHASYLLGQVVQLKMNVSPSKTSEEEITQLSCTLDALSLLLSQDVEHANGAYYCGAMAMCNSALLTLHTPAFYKNSTTVLTIDEGVREIARCKRTADRVMELGRDFWNMFETLDLDTLAPLVPDSMYQAAVVFGYLARETGDLVYFEAFDSMRRGLVVFRTRWRMAGEYLKLLDEDGMRLYNELPYKTSLH